MVSYSTLNTHFSNNTKKQSGQWVEKKLSFQCLEISVRETFDSRNFLDKSISIGKILGFNNRQNESGVSKAKLFTMEMNKALLWLVKSADPLLSSIKEIETFS